MDNWNDNQNVTVSGQFNEAEPENNVTQNTAQNQTSEPAPANGYNLNGTYVPSGTSSQASHSQPYTNNNQASYSQPYANSNQTSYSQPYTNNNQASYSQPYANNNQASYSQPYANSNQSGYGQPNVDNSYGQPYPNYNQGSYQGANYTPVEKEDPVKMGEWILLLALTSFVPCVGWILALVWAFSKTEKQSKVNFCKAYLIIWLVKLALGMIFFIIYGAIFASVLAEF